MWRGKGALGCRFIHSPVPAFNRSCVNFWTLPGPPSGSKQQGLRGPGTCTGSEYTNRLFPLFLSRASPTSPPAQAVSSKPIPGHTAPRTNSNSPQHRATQALKICLSLMIQDSARHTDNTQNWVEIQLSQPCCRQPGEGGVGCWLETLPPDTVATSQGVSVPYLHGNQPSTGMGL